MRVFTSYINSYAYPALTCLVYLPYHRAGSRPSLHPYMSMRVFTSTLYLTFTYLTTELEVDHDDGDLRHRDDQDDEHKEKETKQVIKLVLPYCLQST